jgi:hypothetical protein
MSKGTVWSPERWEATAWQRSPFVPRFFRRVGKGDDEESLVRDIPGCDALVIRGVPVTRRVVEAADRSKS